MKYSVCDSSYLDRVQRLFTQTFSDSEGETEGALIGELAREMMVTTNPEDIMVFVAEGDGHLAGCIMMTRMGFDESERRVYLLSPVAVRTDCQRKGVGQGLIRFALEVLRAQGVEFVITYGDPNYYGKVGFEPVSEAVVPAPRVLTYPEGWLALSLCEQAIPAISGRSSCVSALDKQVYW
ncbi:acetyltransferase [Photobacterium aquae]|uniref:Acetyltransferase n=1 Tax=Photobacterium aquae TaxID=1195763 RepID=A0A0J1HD07_9GAMM|nr:N-acetyltransferase [Photobacterium aquae]KLV09525.1 acetyltransferase [Photobacterium aquae]